jgi:hypothetical protein
MSDTSVTAWQRDAVRSATDSIAAFDSALGTVHLVASALRGQDLPRLGQGRLAALGVRSTSLLPAPLRRVAYARAGAAEGVPADQLAHVDLASVARYIAATYPERRFPGVLVGAANGGMAHLAAAAQIPYLPQTVLVPVRWSGNRPDRPDHALRWGRQVAGPFLAANDDIDLHHMHDGNQDRLMVGQMAYFRSKWRELPEGYRRFLSHRLRPGAPILLVRGQSRWPVTRVEERHVFQNGAYGGLAPDDYARRPHAPHADEQAPEAEWGTTASFETAVRSWASSHGHPVVDISTSDPQELASRSAGLYAVWRRSTGLERPRLVVDQFIQSQPWHVLRTGAVPFWTVFPVEHCAAAAEQWINDAGPFRRIDVALFNHGVASDGLAGIHRWQALTRKGDEPGRLLGQSPGRFPADFASFARATSAFRSLPDGPPWAPLPVSALGGLQADTDGRIHPRGP